MGIMEGEDMTNRLLLLAGTALVLMSGVTYAQNQQPQDTKNAPTALQSTTPDKPPVATVPEAATDVAGVRRTETTGQAPNVSKIMGAEMDSAGDPRAAPDEQ
jgi:hypothetical protein